MQDTHTDIERRLTELEARPDGGAHRILELRVEHLQRTVDGINMRIWAGLAVLSTLVGSVITILVQKALT